MVLSEAGVQFSIWCNSSLIWMSIGRFDLGGWWDGEMRWFSGSNKQFRSCLIRRGCNYWCYAKLLTRTLMLFGSEFFLLPSFSRGCLRWWFLWMICCCYGCCCWQRLLALLLLLFWILLLLWLLFVVVVVCCCCSRCYCCCCRWCCWCCLLQTSCSSLLQRLLARGCAQIGRTTSPGTVAPAQQPTAKNL